MHDMAIEERTRLQLQLEKKEQEQKLIDYELSKDHQRKEEKQKMEHQETLHKNEINKLRLDAELESQKQKTLVDMENYKVTEDLKQTYAKTIQENEIEYYETLKKMGVDMTAFLVARQQAPAKLIKIEGASAPHVKINAE